MVQSKPENPPEPISVQLQAVTAIIKASEYSGILDSGFNIVTFAQQAEFRGMKGEALWTQEMLQKVMSRYQKHVATHPTEPEKIDASLRLLSSKISVNIDRLRRCFYGIPEPQPEAVDLFPADDENTDYGQYGQ